MAHLDGDTFICWHCGQRPPVDVLTERESNLYREGIKIYDENEKLKKKLKEANMAVHATMFAVVEVCGEAIAQNIARLAKTKYLDSPQYVIEISRSIQRSDRDFIQWMAAIHDIEMKEIPGTEEWCQQYQAQPTSPLKCPVCGEIQFDTPSGITCKNGHGGALPDDEE